MAYKIAGHKAYYISKELHKLLQENIALGEFTDKGAYRRTIKALRTDFEISLFSNYPLDETYQHGLTEYRVRSRELDVIINSSKAIFKSGDHKSFMRAAGRVFSGSELLSKKMDQIDSLKFMPRLYKLGSISYSYKTSEPIAAWMFRGSTSGFAFTAKGNGYFFEKGGLATYTKKYSFVEGDKVLTGKVIPEKYKNKILFNMDLFT